MQTLEIDPLHAARIAEADIAALIDCRPEIAVDPTEWLEFAWDMRRQLPASGLSELRRWACLVDDDDECTTLVDDAWRDAHRPFDARRDRLLAHLAHDARLQGWIAPADVSSMIDRAVTAVRAREAAAAEAERVEFYAAGVAAAADEDRAEFRALVAAAEDAEAEKMKGVPMPAGHVPPGGTSMMERGDWTPPLDPMSDEAIALRFTDEHAGTLRYVAQWGTWMVWDGTVWKRDSTLHAFDLARKICRETAVGPSFHHTHSKTLASAKTVAAVERLAKADRRHAATPEQWDADPWLLNTPAGIVDLRTGAVRDASPDDHMTKVTGASPGGDCPTWLAFLARVTGGDVELQAFLQRMAGYALTGSTREHALFFAYGLGANGKSVFTDTLAGILGDYHRTAPIETFIASTADRHPTDLAGLMGARLVTAVETEANRRWAEAKIKAITGGDRVSARFMRQDFFEFTPQFKLLTVGNHKPGLRNIDEAMSRRMNLVPFAVTIPESERDPHLRERLKAEWPGILAWAIEGCIAWQRVGLQAPAAVRDATEEYLSAEDALGTWIDERCRLSADGWETGARLYMDWTTWAHRAGEFVGSQKTFSQRLIDRGLVNMKRGGNRGFSGIWLRPPDWMEKAENGAPGSVVQLPGVPVRGAD